MEKQTSSTVSRKHCRSHVLIYPYPKVNGLEIVKSTRTLENRRELQTSFRGI